MSKSRDMRYRLSICDVSLLETEFNICIIFVKKGKQHFLIRHLRCVP